MIERPKGFLAEIFQEPQPHPEVASYLSELHEILWRVVRSQFPWAQGNLEDYLDVAIEKLEYDSKDPRGSE